MAIRLNDSGRGPGRQVARQYGPSDFARFESLRAMSAGRQDIGKVDVDCKLRLSDSKCGVLGRSNQPAAIMYMDLAFNQPSDCRLARATVRITLEEHSASPPPYASSLGMTDDFGPHMLCGPLKTEAASSENRLTPFIEYAGVGMGGLGQVESKMSLHERRWTFGGHLVPPNRSAPLSMRNGSYRTLQWDLEENSFEPQALHRQVFRTAFVFEHDVTPFVLNVEIDGKLQRRRDRIRHFSFPQSQRRWDGTTRTLIDLTPQYRPNAPSFKRLDQLAARIRDELTDLNRKAWACQANDVDGTEQTAPSTPVPMGEQKLEQQDDSAAHAEDGAADNDAGTSLEYLRQAGMNILESRNNKNFPHPAMASENLQDVLQEVGPTATNSQWTSLIFMLLGALQLVTIANLAGIYRMMAALAQPLPISYLKRIGPDFKTTDDLCSETDETSEPPMGEVHDTTMPANVVQQHEGNKQVSLLGPHNSYGHPTRRQSLISSSSSSCSFTSRASSETIKAGSDTVNTTPSERSRSTISASSSKFTANMPVFSIPRRRLNSNVSARKGLRQVQSRRRPATSLTSHGRF
ncbi:hypothetical protein B0I35DRAFT_435928 [Stachybotrys elegans]|uniref:Uncharacterized protein n=1 Tax=Stachybotrys elegans TaxID=80388 RepID=A0A8K0STT0_9HYPO|nr:hypothetical protein B0I35DRAFT_435928 [Stachybotrys elegans]